MDADRARRQQGCCHVVGESLEKRKISGGFPGMLGFGGFA